MGPLQRLRHAAAETTLFAGFAALYEWPVLAGLLESAGSDQRLSEGAATVLASPAVMRGLALEVATHLGVLVPCYIALGLLAKQLARVTGLARRVVSLLVLGAGWIWLVSGNAVLFAHSNYSVPFAVIANPLVWGLSSAVLAACLGWVLWSLRNQATRALAWLGAGGSVAGLLLVIGGHGQDAIAGSATQRNVVIIGIDSLSAPLLEREQARLPHLTRLLAQGTRYERAYTPIGRTYPAWVSVLSGQSPAAHRATFNLRAVEQADRENLLSRALQVQGYRTVYAIDERRFNNIDESFGFDRIIGPQAGVLDFAVQGINDTPLTNLLLQTRAGRWLLPYSHLNVAAVPSYDATGFVDEIGRAAAGSQPLFLAVHFLSGHFPFATRHATLSHPDPNRIRARHVQSLTTADAQVGQLMQTLAETGRLEDTLIIVLSDHGEALGDNEPVEHASGERLPSATYGHGTDLLSEHQNRVALATLHYRHGKPVAPGPSVHEQRSLLDVRAAVEGFVRDGRVEFAAKSECIPVETELRLASAGDYRHLDMRAVAAEGAQLYELDDEARLRLKEGLLPELTAQKDIGWRCQDRLTIFTPRDGRYRTYRLAPPEAPKEQPLVAGDVDQIDRYRRHLLDAAAKGTRAASRPLG